MKYEWEKDINANALIEKADDALIGFGEGTLQSRYRGECNVTVLAVAVVNHDSGEAALIFPDGYEVTDVCKLDLVQDILGDARRVYNEGHQQVFKVFREARDDA